MATIAAWVNEGTDPDVEKAHQYGIRDLYFAARNQDGRLNDEYLKHYRNLGFTCGIYWADTWDSSATGAQWAEIVNRYWLNLNGHISLLKVQFNIEVHNPERVLACFRQWRMLRRFAITSWALEGFQGGWVESIAPELLRLGITVVPEAYDGAMNPFDPRGVVRDLVKHKVPESLVTPFYGAKDVHRGIDELGGFIYQLADLR